MWGDHQPGSGHTRVGIPAFTLPGSGIHFPHLHAAAEDADLTGPLG